MHWYSSLLKCLSLTDVSVENITISLQRNYATHFGRVGCVSYAGDLRFELQSSDCCRTSCSFITSISMYILRRSSWHFHLQFSKKYLLLSHNRIDHLAICFALSLPQLETLDLSFNDLTTLDPTIFQVGVPNFDSSFSFYSPQSFPLVCIYFFFSFATSSMIYYYY